MALLALFLAKFLDPISFIIAGISGYKFYSKPLYTIILIGIMVSVIVEAVLPSTQITRTFGQGLPLGVVVSCLHALIGRLIAIKRNVSKSNN